MNPKQSISTDQLIQREIELNAERFMYDQYGVPRFLESILGITKDAENLEFIVKYKYIRICSSLFLINL